ncbi:MAG: 30S ribosomal protein S16 [bacterium]|nr:30S ribosomal protein S16 [bacterium]
MVKIRLSRVGSKNQAKYRIISADESSPRDGKFLEILGNYDPTVNPPKIQVNKDRFDYWISVGAQPTEAVASLIKKL